MNPYTISVLACLLLFVLMPLFSIIGHRAGQKAIRLEPDGKKPSTGVVDAGILSLLGLLIAFTFSGAYFRYDQRRQLIVEEANTIGTAYLLLDLLPDDKQQKIRDNFQEYLKSRLELWRLLPDREAALKEYAHSEKLQQAIWDDAVEAIKSQPPGSASQRLLPALNEMIDITTTRLVAVQSHPSTIIFVLLGSLSLLASWIVGFGMAKSGKLSYRHVIGFAIIATCTLYVILDIEYPRFGLITLDMPHQLFDAIVQKTK